MKIERKTQEAIMYLDQRIDVSNSISLRTEFLILLAEEFKRIVLDFRYVQSIDSSGLGKILYFHEQLKNRNGKLIIRNVNNSYILDLFNMIYLDQIIEIEEGDAQSETA